MTYDIHTLSTPCGAFTAVADGDTVVATGFTAHPEALRARLPDPGADLRRGAPAGRIPEALAAYFEGADLTAVDGLEVRRDGSAAMRRLWDELRRVPAGEVRTYAELGGDRRHARVAGAACARNPVPLIVPCHRVIRAGGALGGFAWGPAVKRWLLEHEAAAAGRAPIL